MLTKVSALLAVVSALLLASTPATAQFSDSSSTNAPSGSVVKLLSGQVNHVFIVMEENHSYTDVIGNPAMPYLNSLASTYSVAQGYYANTHPSIGNYFMLKLTGVTVFPGAAGHCA
jgi:hypothetical protein